MKLIRRHLRGVLILLGLTALTLTGCSPAGPPAIDRDPNGHELPYEELAEPRPSIWGLLNDGSAGEISENQLVIYFSSPWEPTCTRHDADVVETAESITITMFAGRAKNHKELKCPSDIIEIVGHSDTMVIDLDAPVGDRTIISGNSETVYTIQDDE